MSLTFVSPTDTSRPAAACASSLWFLAYTRPRLEAVALQNLQQQGFNAYLPLYKRLKQIDTGPQVVFEPMFARYVFFQTTAAARSLAPVRSTRGIAQVVSFGSELASISDEVLGAIRHAESDRNAASLDELSHFRPGHAVRFCSPALQGLEGVVKSVSCRRVAVLLEFMGRQQLLNVTHHQLEAA